jgi:hypothetical protein
MKVGVQIETKIHSYMNMSLRLSHTLSILETLATFHLLMSPLNSMLMPEDSKSEKLVTTAVLQSAIGPYVVVAVVGIIVQSLMARSKSYSSVMAVCAATCAGRKRSSARPARRCDRNARAQLHRMRHNVLHRHATRCNVVCVASSCNEEHQVAPLWDASR